VAILSPQAAPPAGTTSEQRRAITPNAFTKASKRKVEPFADLSSTLGTSAKTIQQIDVPATGYLRHIVLDVQVDGVTAATYVADAPWSILSSVMLSDVNGQPIVLLSGYDLFLANLLGGYAQNPDPVASPVYSKGATGFRFQLRIPVEIVQRNALGALPNLNASMTYKLKMNLAPSAEVFASVTGTPNVRIRAHVESWTNPVGADVNGVPNVTTPPALGTTQNWTNYASPVVVGQNTIRLPRVGNVLRNLIFVFRDETGARTDAGIPAEVSKFIDGNQWTRNSFTYELQRMWELYGFGASQRPTGVWVVALTDDFDGTPGEEMGDYWLPTSGATRLEVQGTFTAKGSLGVITNDILAVASAGGAGQTLGSDS